MADTLNSPWIHDYFINAAETYGSSLSSAPVYTKCKKVQIIEFLTYQESENDDCVWAIISDRNYSIPARFTKDALDHYQALQRLSSLEEYSQGMRLTQHRGAIVLIKNFRPLFTRRPVGNGVKKMTKESTLALDVDYVEIIGSAQEPMFGSPQELKNSRLLEEWMDGLRKGGGDGNVLKARKQQQDAQSHSAVEKTVEPAPITSEVQMPLNTNNSPVAAKILLKPARPVDLTREHRKSWHVNHNSIQLVHLRISFSTKSVMQDERLLGLDMMAIKGLADPSKDYHHCHVKRPFNHRAFVEGLIVKQERPLEDEPLAEKKAGGSSSNSRRADRGPLDFSSPTRSPVPDPSSPLIRPTTPSQWSATAASESDAESADEEPDSHSLSFAKPSLSFGPPSPRVPQDGSEGSSSQPSPNSASREPLPSSPPNSFLSSIHAPTPAQRQKPVLHSSSLPLLPPDRRPLTRPVDKVTSMPNLFMDPDRRRVPLPIIVLPRSNGISDERSKVLVADSDTSGNASQLHNPSQSQSQSESHTSKKNNPLDVSAQASSQPGGHLLVPNDSHEVGIEGLTRSGERENSKTMSSQEVEDSHDGEQSSFGVPGIAAPQHRQPSPIAVKDLLPDRDDSMTYSRLKKALDQRHTACIPLPKSPVPSSSLPVASYSQVSASQYPTHSANSHSRRSPSQVGESISMDSMNTTSSKDAMDVDITTHPVTCAELSVPPRLTSRTEERSLPMVDIFERGQDTAGEMKLFVKKRKLRGFELDLELKQEDGRPELVTWKRLCGILLRTEGMRNGNG
ncbi:hypothetical protein HETIRDRAFT_320137 [Heterobasidion irregulare TC 32-1]|uniref:Shelterin complex subunit TPP1/Est3 domain-containing protein n=1 Tax=Heterobasidion irregulare (strain TC 32-1) TaxID=747525 RepID=W4K3X8_HETIT|nr:uncharacterized protein HETIRDRAFT_320137 [Heterobasidion irregulare TC 32-1]ETW80444.1 hypothetical protein HETIRDRAFT_320137 [Heterobasidion irregulare TC 32-1]